MLLTKDYFPAVILLFNYHILVPRWTRSDSTDANTYGEYYALFYTHIQYAMEEHQQKIHFSPNRCYVESNGYICKCFTNKK